MEPTIEVELTGHVCEPNAKCSVRGKRLRLVVRKGDAAILRATYAVSVHFSKKLKAIWKSVDCIEEFNAISRLDEERVSQAVRQKIESYAKSNKSCSEWVEKTFQPFRFHEIEASGASASLIALLLLLGVFFVLDIFVFDVNPLNRA